MAKVSVLYTGGTFGMVERAAAGGVALFPSPLEDIAKFLPQATLLSEGIEVSLASMGDAIDSSSITPQHWLEVAAHIRKRYLEFDGFVIIHGTDTLAYTASALSFMCRDLGKPVVLTGASRPIFEASSDGLANYVAAVRLAAHPRAPAEVLVLFGASILRGCRSYKMGGEEAYVSPCFPSLGSVSPSQEIGLYPPPAGLAKPRPAKPYFASAAAAGVIDFPLFPGVQSEHIERALAPSSVRGAVIRSWGAGNGPSDASFYQALARAIHEGGKVVVNVTQCLAGAVSAGRYAAGMSFVRAGVISGGDMTVEAAITKLMVALADASPYADISSFMAANICGERSC